MKNVLTSIFLFAALLFSGCVSEPAETGNAAKGEAGKITFILPNASGSTITYVAAEGDEDKLEHLDVYMFDKTIGTLEWIYRSADIGLGSSGSANTVTIDATEREGAKVFFFVGNADGVVAQLDAARYGETTVDQFRAMVSDVHPALPVTPLIMTAETEIADITDAQDDEKKVKLIRRVARFDIDNTATDTNFTIEKIFIGNVNKQGHMFADDTRTTPAIMESGNIPEIVFGTDGNKNQGLEKAVFYTFPTTIGDGLTTLSFEGKFMGADRIYNLDMGQDFNIEANKRYILKPKKIDVNKIDWEVTVDPWNEGVPVETKPNDKKVVITEPVIESGDGVLTNRKLDVSAATAPTVLKLTASSFHKDGVEVNIVYDNANAKAIIDPVVNNVSSILTYGAHYEQAYEITIPKPTNTAPASLTIEFVSKADPRERQKVDVVTFQNYDGTAFKPVMLGGIWWAPVNVGATTMDNTLSDSDCGKLFQWGRSNDGWYPSQTASTIEGPITMEQANHSDNINKFITMTQGLGYPDIQFWNTEHDYSMWNGTNVQGPCPNGWRLPTVDDISPISKMFGANDGSAVIDETIKYLLVKGNEDGELIKFPIPGYMRWNDGLLGAKGANGFYWTSSIVNQVDRKTANCLAIRIPHPTLLVNVVLNEAHIHSHGFSVRCVADAK